MPRFRNFEIWRGRLPHWRADDVTYFVTFRHRRDLSETEVLQLLSSLLRPEGRQWQLAIACVLPAKTELMFSVNAGPTGRPYELADIVERAKNKVGRAIMRKTGEKVSPFYGESFDRIVRDEVEFEERLMAILDAPDQMGWDGEAADYPGLYLSSEAAFIGGEAATPSE